MIPGLRFPIQNLPNKKKVIFLPPVVLFPRKLAFLKLGKLVEMGRTCFLILKGFLVQVSSALNQFFFLKPMPSNKTKKMSNFFFTLPRRKIEAPQIALGEIPSARQDRSLLGFESSDGTSSTTSTDQSLSLESVDLPYFDNNFSLRPSSVGSSAESTESADSASSANTRSSNESTQVLRSERSQREFINILEGVRLRKATHALLIAVRALLTLLFLFLLLRKMQGHLQTRGGYPWILILAPLYTGNFLRIGPSLFSGSHFYPDTSLHFTPTIYLSGDIYRAGPTTRSCTII